MAADNVEIANQSLSNIGVSDYIESLTEDSNEAEKCNLFFHSVRKRLLRQFNWPFAKRQVALVLSDETVTGWNYCYVYPADCINARKIVNNTARNPNRNQKIQFKVFANAAGTGRLICTDQADAVLEYTVDITDPTMFDELFDETFGWCLSDKIAGPLKVDAKFVTLAGQKAAYWLKECAGVALDEEEDDQPNESQFVEARS